MIATNRLMNASAVFVSPLNPVLEVLAGRPLSRMEKFKESK
jgi:hypothetical protein